MELPTRRLLVLAAPLFEEERNVVPLADFMQPIDLGVADAMLMIPMQGSMIACRQPRNYAANTSDRGSPTVNYW